MLIRAVISNPTLAPPYSSGVSRPQSPAVLARCCSRRMSSGPGKDRPSSSARCASASSGNSSLVTNSRTVPRIRRCSSASPKSIYGSPTISPPFHAGVGPLLPNDRSIDNMNRTYDAVKGRAMKDGDRATLGGNVRRGQVLESATRLFTEKGYEAASVRDLAAELEIRPSSLYHHFPGKQHILFAICMRMQTDFNAEVMPELVADRPPDEAIAAAVRRHVIFGHRRKGEVVVNIRERRSLPPEQLAQVNALRRDYRDTMARVIEAGCERGIFCVGEPKLAAMAIVDLTVRFGGILALDQVSLRIDAGEVVAIIGPNGAGKTTLFNAICGFVRPDRGRIDYRGEPLLGTAPHRLARLGIARTLQGLGLWPGLTVKENVVAGSTRRPGLLSSVLALPHADRLESELAAKARDILDRLGIASYAGAYPGTLPYGVQKRVIIARALMAAPSLLLLDEPVSGLSAGDIEDLANLIKELRTRMSVAVVEHHLDFVMAISDRVTVLNLGRVIASGTPKQIQDDPQVATAYLGADIPTSEASSGA